MKIFNQLKSIPKLPTPKHLKVKLIGEWDECPSDRVLYVHYRADDGLPYYVGYGTPKRPNDVGRVGGGLRNDDWHEVFNKHGRRVEVKITGLHEHVANIIETWWIYSYRQKYGRYDEGGTMVNKSSGGGCPATGSKRNAEQLEKMSVANKELWADENSAFNTEGYREKLSAAMKIALKRPEVQAKRSAARSRPEVKAKMIAAKVGKFGEQHNSFQGYSIGVNEEQFVILSGTQEMKGCGFHHSAISKCISGRLPHYKKFRWTRQRTINPQDFLHLKPFNELSLDRVIEAMPEDFFENATADDFDNLALLRYVVETSE